MVDHVEIKELLGAYALDAIERAEAGAVSRHIPNCAECREELERHGEAVAMMSATERSAPAGLWDTIARELPDKTSSPPLPPITAIERRATHRSRFWLRPAAAVAAGVLAGAAIVGLLQQGPQQTDAAQPVSTEDSRTDDSITPASGTVGGRIVTLSTPGNDTTASIVLRPNGTGFMAAHTLAPLPPDRTYQLWAIVGGRTISAGVLGSSPTGAPFRIDLEGFEGFAITEEVVGGVERSLNAPIVAWLQA